MNPLPRLPRLSRVIGLLAAVTLVAPVAACGSDSDDSPSSDASSSGASSDGTTITVLAAASLTESFGELAKTFEGAHPGVTVKLAFDSSATLAQQAVEGAPADVLATADTRTMDDAKSAVTDAPEIFATNQLVMVTPADNPAGITSFDDIENGDVTYVACVETAPCGDIWATLAKKDDVTSQPASLEVDVKSVLAKVTSDEADAGFVYSTDAVAAGDDVKEFPVPGSDDEITSYPIAVLQQSDHSDLAREFVDLVTSKQGRSVLEKAGFGAP
ncbi:molybdate ABC transporter substrate-binding protein [Nocardioides acrostichi]|uniref:molybdate ABC transporter substrate-binding protein n=1 Tax=Nocardioides acrostichi TaxID=2784339 RepID=UPI001A9C9273|nr:molybdate ABC transporter substrate-binding protein [Nocardioides acrostichi]